jgi:ParB-like chromosome segregation protein Spo0J
MKQKAKSRETPNNDGNDEKPAAQATSAIAIMMLPVTSLKPNSWNPNTIDKENWKQQVEETRRLGRPAKPIVVRAKGKHYQIVDGEHSWKAALECGLTEVPCEVISADDFEAMFQSFKRNLHGVENQVKLGRMFRRMLDAKKLSNRDLASQLGVAEGTIRNVLLYAGAADLRNHYAAEMGNKDAPAVDAEIAKLSVKEIRRYVELPEKDRDEWFDGGRRMDQADRLNQKSSPVRLKIASENDDDTIPETSAEGTGNDQACPENHPTECDGDAIPETTAKAVVNNEACPDGGASGEENSAGAEPPTQGAEYEPAVLNTLEEDWKTASQSTRKKFLAGILAEPGMLAFARQIIKQGS